MKLYNIIIFICVVLSYSVRSSDYQIVRLDQADYETVATWLQSDRDIKVNLGLSYWSNLRDYFDPADGLFTCLIAKKLDDHQIHGFIKYAHIHGVGSIDGLAVNQQFRGQKIGQKLLSAALLDTRRVSYWQLFVDPANESAIRLYTKNGFKKYHKFDDVMDCMIAPAHRK